MGNHTVDCEFCGEDLRGAGCAKDCPAAAYACAQRAYREQERAYVADVTTMWREALAAEERDAVARFRLENAPPVRPPTVWEARKQQAAAPDHVWTQTSREYDDTFFTCSNCGATTNQRRGWPPVHAADCQQAGLPVCTGSPKPAA